MQAQNKTGLARIFFPREAGANPYYTSNRLLGQCAALALELTAAGVPVLELQGGHRSGLEADCQLFVSLADEAALTRLSAPYGCRWELL